ncbi:MAG: NADH-quinone oxidoreductase subunit H [Planctomycetota bacterium]|nr:NADH-quinone oxidoreductase subunit H [Planctomycetota bacterium]
MQDIISCLQSIATPQLIAHVIVIMVIANLMLGGCAYLILLERKVAAWTQDRIGPNRVNFSFGLVSLKSKHFGLGQALVDGVKLLVKEDYDPPQVDKILFYLAPVFAVGTALVGWAIIPWGGLMQWGDQTLVIAAADINIGIIYPLAIGSLAVYGVVVGGYASTNKYSFLGALRATAQMLSYEIPMSLCVLIIILMSGTPRAEDIAVLQAAGGLHHSWNILFQPLLAVIFFTCVLAECNRAPFDLAESEQELVGGYHTEYSSMKWALFFLGEYMHMITGSAMFALLFLGGWDLLPFLGALPAVGGIGLVLLKFAIFAGKVFFLLFVMMWIRWSLPRFRFDQLMRLAWRSLIPMTLILLLASGVIVYLRLSPWYFLLANIAVFVGGLFVGPLLPQGPPVNRRVPLAGSRFSPLVEVAAKG